VTAKLVDLIYKAPVLPAKSDASRILQRELLDRLDPDEIAALKPVLDGSSAASNLVAGIIAHSPFLAQEFRHAPLELLAHLQTAPDVRFNVLVEQLEDLALVASDPFELMRPLRLFRRNVATLVALADLGGAWTVDEVVATLSTAADLSVRLTVNAILRTASERGRYRISDNADPGAGSGLIVLALGKHGAGELNYSSDIDIVVFYDPNIAEVAGISDPSPFYVRLTRDLARILQERTADGYVHRVDLRLRPDPGTTAAAVSLPSAYAYYETLGQNWERAAYIKARPIAGDIALGARFLVDLVPFIWRKYFDFAAISDIHAMKRQIQAVKGHETIAVAGHDVKLGRGGIREIEFFVQTQQLVFGGKNPVLRGRRTLDMLSELQKEQRISPEARDELSAAYRFLREIEHRLQMRLDEQTQRLPSSKVDLEGFARFCGYAGTTAFGAALTETARVVERHYAMLFEDAPTLAAKAGSLSFTGTDDDPETLKTIARLGFKDVSRVTETVRGWHFGRRSAIRTARAREVLTELTPALLVAMGQTAEPDAALNALDNAFERMPAAVELLTLLRSNESMLSLFAEILGSAPRLADTLSLYPHVLDGIIDPSFVEPEHSIDQLYQRIRSAVGNPPPDAETGLDRLRDGVRQEVFLTGARMLSGIATPAQTGHAYSAIAQATISVALQDVRHWFAVEHGHVRDAEIAIIALGRLGAHELTATSDLDLMIVYDFPVDAGPSDGIRPLDPVVYHLRLVQRLVAALSVPTRRGLLYDVDLRLRPAGSKGSVASRLDGFLAYQLDEAETWEHMALAKARIVAGDQDISIRLDAVIRRILLQKRDRNKTLTDAAQMRAMIAKEKGDQDSWDLKLAAGGLTDIDFIAETLLLVHSAEHPELINNRSVDVISASRSVGILKQKDADILIGARQLFNDVTQWQRFAIAGPVSHEAVAARVLRRIAHVYGLPDVARLKSQLDEKRSQVRVVFNSIMMAGAGGAVGSPEA
jgi:[glutamine synthetase] adenylyltransferase / [glutamine synthetase]-adenylyl-L-tyrosine phosphorylase